MSKPFLAKIPVSLASQAGSSAEAVELYPTVSGQLGALRERDREANRREQCQRHDELLHGSGLCLEPRRPQPS